MTLRPMAPYLTPGRFEKTLPLLYRSEPMRRTLLALNPAGSRLRRELAPRFFAWCYANFNRTGEIPEAVFAPEIVLEQSAALIDTAGSFQGRDGVARALKELRDAFDGVRFEPEAVAELGAERILFLVRFHASGSGSGIEIDRTVGHLFTLRDGYAGRWEVYWEKADALEAAGLQE